MEDAPPNLATRVAHTYGDLESAFSGAALVLDNVYDYPMVYAYAMEPYTAIAEWDERGLTVTSSTQSPFMVQAQLAHCFKLPLSAVRVSIPDVGGAFGSKGYAKIEPLTAALALRAGRPVRLALSVEESILTGRSVPARIHLATAFDGDGRIRGRRAKLWLNSGAYTDNTGRVAGRAARRLGGAYRIPAMEVDALAVYTNTAPAASYRGLGARQAVFAGESQLDEAAAALGIDPLELRRRNLLRRGERAWPGARGMDADLPDDLRMVEEAIEWERQPVQDRAQGVAIAASDAGAEPTTSCILRLLADGSVVVMSGSSEFGQGSSTVLAQIAAAELGVTVDAVRFINSDTASVSFDRSTGASRTTTMQGLAIQRAAMDAREQLVGWARQLYAGDGPEPIEERGGVRVGDLTHSWSKVINDWFGPGSGEAIGRGYARRDGVTAELPLFWEVALTGIDAEVDRETGEIKVHRLVSLSDVGRAVNPRLLEGQDIGGAMMGLGIAQREELIYEEGMLQNGNLFDYRVPRTADLPEIRSIVAERADGVGAYGIKGGGEGSVNPVAPALATAVERATGVRLRQAPLTPERVWRALREAAAADAAAATPDREGHA
jgi:CO/xanthine dehydrogenase Mo-binding subunit